MEFKVRTVTWFPLLFAGFFAALALGSTIWTIVSGDLLGLIGIVIEAGGAVALWLARNGAVLKIEPDRVRTWVPDSPSRIFLRAGDRLAISAMDTLYVVRADGTRVEVPLVRWQVRRSDWEALKAEIARHWPDPDRTPK